MEMAKPLINFGIQIEVGNDFRPYRGLKLVFLLAWMCCLNWFDGMRC